MQAIPPAIKTLLKSRSMVGPDAPTGRLIIDTGKSAGTEWTDPHTCWIPTEDVGVNIPAQQEFWGTSVSIARRAAGDFIFVGVWSPTGDNQDAMPVYEGRVASIEDLVSGHDTVTNWQPTGVELYRFGRATVFNVGDGLYMTTSQAGTTVAAGARLSNSLIWRSPSGNGGDWALLGTMQSVQLASSSYTRVKHTVGGVVHVLPSGRWVICMANWQQPFGRVGYPAIYTSENQGATWALRQVLTVPDLTNYTFGRGWSRHIVRDSAGRLWAAVDGSGTQFGHILYCSEDEGLTWTIKASRIYAEAAITSARFAPALAMHPDGQGVYVWTVDGDHDESTLYLYPDPFNWATIDDSEVVNVISHTTIDSRHFDWQGKPIIIEGLHPLHTVVFVGFLVFGFEATVSELIKYPAAANVLRGAAALSQRATTEWPNIHPADPADPGYYSPDRGIDYPEKLNEWHGILMPGRAIRMEMGYGTDLARVFTGTIDEVILASVGPAYNMRLDCRDAAWQLIDKTIQVGATYKITYVSRAVEYIVRDLLIRAGIPDGDITTQPTGITIRKKTFERFTYADALEWCLKVSGFELIFDEYGLVSYHYPTDRQPEASDEALVLNGTDWTDLANPWVVAYSDRVRSATGGGGTLYSRVTDYEIEYGKPARIRRRAGSTIPGGGTVYASYVYAAWSYEEGVDLFRLPYRISRRDIYGKIVVIGQTIADEWFLPEGDPIIATFTYAGAAAYGVPADKVLFVELPELDTLAKCQAAADQLGNDMIRKAREAEFAVPGNPWIQVGDCVRLRESGSTASEIYRVVALSHMLDEIGFITQFEAYHYGYTPLA